MQHRGVDKISGIELQPHQISDAREAIIKDVQKEDFKDKYKAFAGKRLIPVSSPLVKLNPRLDESGVIRSGSRFPFGQSFGHPFGQSGTSFPLILCCI
jgi:hypothetical protein